MLTRTFLSIQIVVAVFALNSCLANTQIREPGSPSIETPEEVTVLAFTSDVEACTPATQWTQQITVVAVPSSAVPDGALSDVFVIEDQVPVRDLSAGDFVRVQDFAERPRARCGNQ